MSKRTNMYEEPETLRLLGLDKLRDEPEDLDEKYEAWERAADRVEQACEGWTDSRGFPLPGFESPRFLSAREEEYKRWYRGTSPEAARTRRNRGER